MKHFQILLKVVPIGLFTLLLLSIPAYAAEDNAACTTNCLRVYSIKMWHLVPEKIEGHVTLVDEIGGRIFGAVVHGVWTMPDGSTLDQYDVIGVSGRAELKLYPTITGTYTLTVAGATKDGYTFDPDNSTLLSNSIYFEGSGNQPPAAVAAATPTSGTAPLAVSFSSAGSNDPDGSIASYSWTFGDGGTSSEANPSYIYTAAGTYTATLTVTDNEGATGVDQVDVTATGDAIDTTAPLISGSVRGKRFVGTATDSQAGDSGIDSIILGSDAVNLTLIVDPFSAGDPSVGFRVRFSKTGDLSSGTVEVRDVAGNLATLFISNAAAPQGVSLDAYPNPFNPETTLNITLTEAATVDIRVYDVLGREVEVLALSEMREPGIHQWHWDASRSEQLTTGTYFVRVKAGNEMITKSILLTK